jgi:hypothetical protein
MLPDRPVGIDQGGGLEESGGDAQALQHRQAVGVVVAQAIVEADDHPPLMRRREGARQQISEGEEQGSLTPEKVEFRLQGGGGDRRHPEAIEHRHPLRLVDPVIEQTVNAAGTAPPPERIERG